MGLSLKVIALDADDTLWDNEIFFRESENRFCEILSPYLPADETLRELLVTETANIKIYGYGIKGFVLSMTETAIRISKGQITADAIHQIVLLGKDMMEKPVQLLPDVAESLALLQPHYRLVMATKGDLVDQHRKLHKSGIGHFFHHIEIMTDKKASDYQRLIARLDILPENFLMIGNSLRSDIVPVLEVGGHAIHVPYHTTWIHEQVEGTVTHERLMTADSLGNAVRMILEG